MLLIVFLSICNFFIEILLCFSKPDDFPIWLTPQPDSYLVQHDSATQGYV